MLRMATNFKSPSSHYLAPWGLIFHQCFWTGGLLEGGASRGWGLHIISCSLQLIIIKINILNYNNINILH